MAKLTGLFYQDGLREKDIFNPDGYWPDAWPKLDMQDIGIKFDGVVALDVPLSPVSESEWTWKQSAKPIIFTPNLSMKDFKLKQRKTLTLKEYKYARRHKLI